MIRSTRLIRVAGLTWLLIATPAGPARPAEAPAPTCALLEDAAAGRPLAVTPLLEARLLASGGVTLLERDAVAAILREQKLQSLFGPEAGTGRVAAGRLLKADLLVLLRDRAGETPGIEVVISETGRGLRLRAEAVPRTEDPEADASAVERLVEGAITKHRERVTEICAVPPFLGQDLSYEFDHLKGAYAKLVEQTLLERKGVLLVELAEARAIADELALTAPGARLERKLPLYFLGEYRHEGRGDRRTATIDLKLMRGEAQLGAARKTGLRPDEAPGALRRAAADLLAKVVAGGPPPDPKAEARQLAERAHAHQRLADWGEAHALIEASLMLDPGQQDLHRDAVVVLNELAGQYWGFGLDFAEKPEKAHRAYNAYLRGLEHLELFLATAGDLAKYNKKGHNNFIGEFSHRWNWMRLRPNAPADDVARRHLEVQERKRETFLRLVRTRARAGQTDGPLYLLYVGQDLPTRDKISIVTEAIADLREVPGTQQRVAALLRYGAREHEFRSPEGRALMDSLTASPDAEARAGVAEIEEEWRMRAEISRKSEAARAARPSQAPPATGPPEVTFRPLEFTWTDPDGETGRLEWFAGIVPAGDGMDVVWDRKQLFLMTTPGRLRRVFSSTLLNFNFTHVGYDGRFVWASAVRHNHAARLFVIDPTNGRVREVTREDGLPTADQDGLPRVDISQALAVAPLGPGRACLAGSFGRAWLAIATFDPASGPSVEVFHEAREVAGRQDKDGWASAKLQFKPTYMHVLIDKPDPAGKAARRVMVGRGENPSGHEVGYHPLVVDPEARTVSVFRGELVPGETPDFVHGGALYRVEVVFQERIQSEIIRVGFPGTTKESVLRGVPDGIVAFLDGRPQIVGKRWWIADTSAGRVRVGSDRVPWIYQERSEYPLDFISAYRSGKKKLGGVYHSNHYGLLVLTTGDAGRWAVYRVEAVAPARSSGVDVSPARRD